MIVYGPDRSAFLVMEWADAGTVRAVRMDIVGT